VELIRRGKIFLKQDLGVGIFMNYLFVKEGNQFNITSIEIFEELCRKGDMKRDTKLYDFSDCEVISVHDIRELREVWDNVNRQIGVENLWKEDIEPEIEVRDRQITTERDSLAKPKRNWKMKIMIPALILGALVLGLGGVYYSSFIFSTTTNDPLAIETLSNITGQFQEVEINGIWDEPDEELKEYVSFINSTKLLYESLEKEIENLKLYVFDEKMEDILSGEIYKDTKEFELLEEELKSYILDFQVLERDIDDQLDRYLQNFRDSDLHEEFKEQFLLEIKPQIYIALDTRLEKHRLEEVRMNKLVEILNFMKNNRHRFVVLKTGLRFFFDNDQDIYIRLLNEFYGIEL
jgi:hypothetical protein